MVLLLAGHERAVADADALDDEVEVIEVVKEAELVVVPEVVVLLLLREEELAVLLTLEVDTTVVLLLDEVPAALTAAM